MTRMVCVLIACALAAPPALPAEKKEESGVPRYRLQWQDLGRVITGRRVAVRLPSGVALQGEVIKLEPDALVMLVAKTSDKYGYPKGTRASLPRPEVTSLRVTKSDGYTWRVAGSIIGAGIGTLIAAPVVAFSNGANAKAAGVGLGVGIPVVLGFLGGRSADVKTFVIDVEP